MIVKHLFQLLKEGIIVEYVVKYFVISIINFLLILIKFFIRCSRNYIKIPNESPIRVCNTCYAFKSKNNLFSTTTSPTIKKSSSLTPSILSDISKRHLELLIKQLIKEENLDDKWFGIILYI